jgi:hypothetical protein
MDCSCGGSLIEGKSCYRSSGDHFCLIFDDVPAMQCSRCGKVYISEETSSKIDGIVRRVEKETLEMVTGNPSVHLYDYK